MRDWWCLLCGHTNRLTNGQTKGRGHSAPIPWKFKISYLPQIVHVVCERRPCEQKYARLFVVVVCSDISFHGNQLIVLPNRTQPFNFSCTLNLFLLEYNLKRSIYLFEWFKKALKAFIIFPRGLRKSKKFVCVHGNPWNSTQMSLLWKARKLCEI